MEYGILASPHTSFSLLLSFFRPYRHSSKDSERSFIPFAIIVGGKIYGARVLEPTLMTVRVASLHEQTYMDVVYENIVDLTFTD